MGIRWSDHLTPLYPQKLALTSPTGGGRSVGIVRSRTKATEFFIPLNFLWVGSLSRYSDWLRAGRSGIGIQVGVRFSSSVQTGPGAHPTSCTMVTGCFPGVKRGRGVTLIPHPLLVPWSWKGRAIPLLPLWAVRPVQSLSVCTRVHFTLDFLLSTFFRSTVQMCDNRKPRYFEDNQRNGRVEC